jgi:hypothetical protein
MFACVMLYPGGLVAGFRTASWAIAFVGLRTHTVQYVPIFKIVPRIGD